MKWFHHECAARYDSKLQTLGSLFGAEGIGIYWGLLEEIGQHSDTFYLKVIGIEKKLIKIFQKSCRIPKNLSKMILRFHLRPHKHPITSSKNNFQKSLCSTKTCAL